MTKKEYIERNIGRIMVRVISAEPAEGYKLRIQLSNGKNGLFDVSPYLDKGVFH